MITILLITIQIITLYFMGQYFYRPKANSGGFYDWYTLSHILHGCIFYLLGMPLPLAVLVEVIWEIVENTPYVINKYRVGGHPDYAGDSIVNSTMDTLACVLGWYLSTLVPMWLVLVFIVVAEIIMYVCIKDNLLLNILVVLGIRKKK